MFGAIVMVAVLVWFGISRYQQQSHQIFGQVVSVTSNTIQVKGFYILDAKTAKSDYSKLYNVTVSVDSNTKFVKVVSSGPSITNNQKINLVDFKTQTVTGMLSDLKKNMSVTIKTVDNILNSSAVTASQIVYTTTQ